jgi:hypothetical protein
MDSLLTIVSVHAGSRYEVKIKVLDVASQATHDLPSTNGTLQQLPTSPSLSPGSHPPFRDQLPNRDCPCRLGPTSPQRPYPAGTEMGFPQYPDQARTVGECCVACRHTMDYNTPAFDGDVCFARAVWHAAWMLELRYLGLLPLFLG